MRVDTVVISTQHSDSVSNADLQNAVTDEVIRKVVPAALMDKNTKFHINPTGRFVVGGPMGDAGLTGRKIIVDTYGGYSRHGGGAFSGKDPSKVDRSACYMARHVAKNLVAAGVARKVEVQLAYAIGVAEPVSVMADTFGTGAIPDEQITDLIRATFKLTPRGIIESLDLRRPIYRPTASFGHFGRSGPGFTWERTDKADAIRSQAGLQRQRSCRRAAKAIDQVISIRADQSEAVHLKTGEIRVTKTVQGVAGDVKDMGLAEAGKAKDRMGQPADARSAIDPQAIHQGTAAQGRARLARACT